MHGGPLVIYVSRISRFLRFHEIQPSPLAKTWFTAMKSDYST